MGAPKGSKNALGNKGGHPYPNRDIGYFWNLLDNVLLPNAAQYCNETIQEVREHHMNEPAWRSLALQAAKIAFSRSPERLANADGSNLKSPIIYLPSQEQEQEQN